MTDGAVVDGARVSWPQHIAVDEELKRLFFIGGGYIEETWTVAGQMFEWAGELITQRSTAPEPWWCRRRAGGWAAHASRQGA
jgi:hypothetical protein